MTHLGQVFLVVMFFSGGSGAAILRGVVTDSLTKSPVESVLVRQKGFTAQAYTDSLGRFTLNTSASALDPGRMETPELRLGLTVGDKARVTVYGADGARLAWKRAGDPERVLREFADGMYLLVVEKGGLSHAGRVKMENGRWADRVGALGKFAAAVTLEFRHKWYLNREAPALEGDTAVAMKLSMWWPDETNTGVPAGVTLAPYTGSINPPNGTVIENKLVTSGFDINSSDITIRNCKIALASGIYGILNRKAGKLLVENCEIYTTNGDGLYTGISGRNITVRRSHIHGWENGLSAGTDLLIEDSYIHRPSTRPGAHNDGIEWGGGSNVVIRHNRIAIRDQTGCVNMGGQGGDLANNSVISNLFSGGTYSLYLEGRKDHTPGGIIGAKVIGNVWMKGSYVYGTHAIMDVPAVTWMYNVLNDGTPIRR
jgi:hypothetical protein